MSYSIMELEPFDWVRITKSYFWGGALMPAPKKWTIYLVSKIVCEQCRDRADFYVVNEKTWTGMNTKAWSLSPNPYYDDSLWQLKV